MASDISMGKTGVRGLVAVAALIAVAGIAPAQTRIVAWNISNYGGTDRTADIRNVVYGVIPAPLALQGTSMSPDIIALQEIQSAAALATFVNVLNTASGSPGDWAGAPYVNGNDTDNALVYRTGRYTLVGNRTWTISVGASASPPIPPRNTYRYDLMPVGYSAPTSMISVFSSHMKAQGGTDDDLQRLTEATRVRDNIEGIDTNPTPENDGMPVGSNPILAGDFNGQSSSESFYVELTSNQANNIGRLFDPINTPGTWNNSSAFRFVHTQDPSGAGGMDDRHDQVLIGSSLKDAAGTPAGWHYIGNPTLAYSTSTWNDPNHSYRAWGNDGTSFNLTMTTAGNSMVGATIAQAVINCAPGGGHIPVFADFRVPATATTSAATINFGSVRVGSLAPTRNLTITNTGNVALWGANGIDTLNYSFGAAAGFTVPAGPQSDAAGGTGFTHTLSMPTAVIGPKNATLIITTDSPEQPTLSVTLTGTVLPPNAAPTANAGPDQGLTDGDNSGTEVVTLNGSLSSDSDGTIASYVWRNGGTIVLSSATGNVVLPVGVTTLTLTVTDNEGATGQDSVQITINPPSNNPPSAVAGGPYIATDSDDNGFQSVTLDASGSSDGDGTITNYEWKDGPTVLCSGPSPTCIWNAPVGTHTVTLIVTDDDLATASTTASVTINPITCDTIDFNNDASLFDPQDIDAFLSVFAEGPCVPETATCNDIDFNNDGALFDPCDIDSFLAVFAEGPCRPCGQ
jgi:hypothetical protein